MPGGRLEACQKSDGICLTPLIRFYKSSFVKLRHHPLMKYGGADNWPPEWKPADPRDNKPILHGEAGVLQYVLCESSNKCFLLIKQEGRGHIGTLRFDDPAFCQQLGKFLTALHRSLDKRNRRFGHV